MKASNFVKSSIIILIFFLISVDSHKKRPCNYQQAKLSGGHGWIQIGNHWRIGVAQNQFFVFSHRSGFTASYYNMLGNYYQTNGLVKTKSLWSNTTDKPGEITGVKFGNDYIQFLDAWKIAVTGFDNHLSISSIALKTGMIWYMNGSRKGGPIQTYNGYYPNVKSGESNIKFGINGEYIQIGNWRLGQNNNVLFSIGTISVTAEILRSDGYAFGGPRYDFNLFSIPQCTVDVQDQQDSH